MSCILDRERTTVLLAEAGGAARRFVRRSRLPRHEIEDAAQDLIQDLLERLPAYDHSRGTFGAFVGVVLNHKSARMARVVRRDRILFGAMPVSLDDPGPEGLPYGDCLSEQQSYAAFFGQSVDCVHEAERRHDVERALTVLPHAGQQLCALLSHDSVDELVARGVGARTTLYRKIKQIRLVLTAAGLTG